MPQLLTIHGALGRALSIGVLTILLFSFISLTHSSLAIETRHTVPLTQIDDFTEYTYRVNNQPLGGFADFVVTRTFTRPIVSLRLTIVQGTADDLGYVGSVLVTDTSPGCGPAGQVVVPVDVTSQVAINGSTASFLLRAQEDCAAFSNSGWGTELCMGCGGVNNARFHWEVTLDDCSYALSPTKKEFDNRSHTDNIISISTNEPCSWTATTDVSWITIHSPNQGTGAGQILYSVAPNTSFTCRTGKIFIRDKSVTIKQMGNIRFAPNWSQGGGASWACDLYANHVCATDPINPCSATRVGDCAAMRHYGCGTVAFAEALFAVGVTQIPISGVPSSLDPGSLNKYMRNHLAGYTLDNNPFREVTLGYIAADTGGQFFFYDSPQTGDPIEELKKQLCFGYPVLVRVRSHTGIDEYTHTVVVTGMQGGSFLINDPGRATNQTLDAYPKDILVLGFVGPDGINTNIVPGTSATDCRSCAPQAVSTKASTNTADLSSLVVRSGENEELMITDATGRRTGHDPESRRILNEIPGATYFSEIIANDEDENELPDGDSRVVKISNPPSGDYRVVITSTAQSSYIISVQPFSQDGSLQTATDLQGTSQTGSAYFDIQYSSASGGMTQVNPVSCAWVSSLGKSFASTGGAGNVSITAASVCSWMATSNSNWITIDSGSTGNGNGTVSYSVAPNPGNTYRSGTITIAGLTHTVYQGMSFNDVPSTHAFYNEISKLSSHGITLGCSNGNYCPDSPVTREQMSAFIMRARGSFDPPSPSQQRFLDVPPSNPFYGFIDLLATLGITRGCGEDTYCPSDNVTREQMAAFVMRSLGEYAPPTPTSQRFGDVPPSNQFYAFIDRMAVRGITLGCSASPPLYCPSETVTRGQMAAFLTRAFGL